MLDAYFSVHFVLAITIYLPRACSMWLNDTMTDKLSSLLLAM